MSLRTLVEVNYESLTKKMSMISADTTSKDFHKWGNGRTLLDEAKTKTARESAVGGELGATLRNVRDELLRLGETRFKPALSVTADDRYIIVLTLPVS